MAKDPGDVLFDVMSEFRQACESRVSNRTYLEVMMVTYHKAIMNILADKGLINDAEITVGLTKYFAQATEEVKKKPMLSPFKE